MRSEARSKVAAVQSNTSREDGYCIVRGSIPKPQVAALREAFDATPVCQGGFYGEPTKRFGRLLARSDLTAAFALHHVSDSDTHEPIGANDALRPAQTAMLEPYIANHQPPL
jgi:hypothetical protein